MKTERELAELIFDEFRAQNLKTNEIVPFSTIHFNLIDKLNPKEKEIFFTVLNGLIYTGYYTYDNDTLECIRLTEKGYDYIYDDDKIKIMKQRPWVIPEVEKTDWNRAYNKLWKMIGPQDTAIHYIGGSQFYKFVLALCDDIPPSYSNYIEQRREKGLSTSRVDYYKDLIDHLDEEKRFQLYVNIQLFIEENNNQQKQKDDLFDIPLVEMLQTETGIKRIINDNGTFKKIVVKQDSEHIPPKIFISYSWDNDKHKEWVLMLANKLCENGVDVVLDRYDLQAGKDMTHFMENSVNSSKRVLLIMTPNFKLKADKRQGGVGYEYSMITAEMFNNQQNEKFIPIVRSGNRNECVPIFVRTRIDIDMSNDAEFEEKLEELLRTIFEEPKIKKPIIGQKPNFT